jgi:hypothetical protein
VLIPVDGRNAETCTIFTSIAYGLSIQVIVLTEPNNNNNNIYRCHFSKLCIIKILDYYQPNEGTPA